MTYASLCDGIGAAHVASQPLGWECAWVSEIAPFPSAVVEQRWGYENLGDMTKITQEMIHARRRVDLICGGTPCQSFSVAGLRKGLADPRGNLCLEFLRIVDAARPRWVVWENVPGVLSSSGGRDFGTFLGGLAELRYGFAYRVLDAQYVRTHGHERAVPQRRRRVFVVGYLGNWRRAAAVLFERESLSGNPAPCREAGKGTAQPVAGSLGAGDGNRGWRNDLDQGEFIPPEWPHEVAGTLDAHYGDKLGLEDQHIYNQKASRFVAGALAASGDGAERGGFSPRAVAIGTDVYNGTITGDIAATMGTSGSGINNAGPPVLAFAQNSRDEVRMIGGDGQAVGALSAETGMHQTNYLLQSVNCPRERKQNGIGVSEGLTGRDLHGLANQTGVRRLTPRECERLMGFPDEYTAIIGKGKPAADGPRYKALGNSWAVNAARWIFTRIQMVDQLTQEHHERK